MPTLAKHEKPLSAAQEASNWLRTEIIHTRTVVLLASFLQQRAFRRNWARIAADVRARERLATALADEPGPLVLAGKPRFEGDARGLLVSADPGGDWRGTRFDRDGFSGHWLGKSKREVVGTALGEGYADTDRGLLRTLMADPRFQEGNERSEAHQRAMGAGRNV